MVEGSADMTVDEWIRGSLEDSCKKESTQFKRISSRCYRGKGDVIIIICEQSCSATSHIQPGPRQQTHQKLANQQTMIVIVSVKKRIIITKEWTEWEYYSTFVTSLTCVCVCVDVYAQWSRLGAQRYEYIIIIVNARRARVCACARLCQCRMCVVFHIKSRTSGDRRNECAHTAEHPFISYLMIKILRVCLFSFSVFFFFSLPSADSAGLWRITGEIIIVFVTVDGSVNGGGVGSEEHSIYCRRWRQLERERRCGWGWQRQHTRLSFRHFY